jgi:antirestriction protein ArdC
LSDALSLVTAEITRMLDQGVMPWRAPWDCMQALAATPGLPLRFTGEPYRGANVVLLWAAQVARGYPKRTWLSYRQALQLGGQVRKGEKAVPVIFYGQAQPKDERRAPESGDQAEQRTYRFVKLFHVFNVEQVDALPAHIGVEMAPAPRAPSSVERWLLRAGAQIRIGGTSAYYSPVTDAIYVPPVDAFLSQEHFEATLLHEGVHFSGAKSRLDRLGDYFTDRRARAREELIAEIGSAILGAMIGLRPDHLDDHAAYIADWLKLLKDDTRAFFSAAAKAQTACDWLIEHAGQPAADDHGAAGPAASVAPTSSNKFGGTNAAL